jgi:DNA helicase HerA-like ATPase
LPTDQLRGLSLCIPEFWRKSIFWTDTGKSQVPYPVLVVLEEAHILAPRDDETLSKYWLARVAREGRKFGIGLMIVSQRPKGLDPDILGQANNLIVLRIVEPSDQRHVQEASESLTSDLVEQLASLNTGEAVVTGPFVRVPALVKVDKFPGRLGGSDPDVVAEWSAYRDSMKIGGPLLFNEF